MSFEAFESATPKSVASLKINITHCAARNGNYETKGFLNGFADDSSLLECTVCLVNSSTTFRTIVVPSCSGLSNPRRRMLDSEKERTAVFRNVELYSLNNTASHPRRFNSSMIIIKKA